MHLTFLQNRYIIRMAASFTKIEKFQRNTINSSPSIFSMVSSRWDTVYFESGEFKFATSAKTLLSNG